MKLTYDLYAETNPAFIAFLLSRFVIKYLQTAGTGPNVSLAYVVVPISLTGSLESTFSATNSRTGFLQWLSRFPEVRTGLHSNIEASKDVVLSGLLASIHGRMVNLTNGHILTIGEGKSPPENVKSKLPAAPKATVSRAERLGVWMAGAGSPATIFSALEVQP
jgi:hypothetical protein